MNTGCWNPETHNILLTRDETKKEGFTIKMLSVDEDIIPITDFSAAANLLQKINKRN
jgi:hypothetical protein